MNSVRYTLVAIPVLAALLHGGCGGGDSETSTPTGENQQQAATPQAVAAAPTPAANKLDLTTLPPVTKEAGWKSVTMHQTPEGKPLVIAGKTYARGIFAAPPSRVTFDVAGQFQTVEGLVGLSDGVGGCYAPGSKLAADGVVFVLEVDGKPKFQSPTVKPGAALPFKTNIAGAKQIALRVIANANGLCDHAIWAAPVLTR